MKHFNNEEFKRGWHVLILAIVGVATSSSSLLLYSFSSMVIPLEQAMGWARSDLQAAITALSLGTRSMSIAGGSSQKPWICGTGIPCSPSRLRMSASRRSSGNGLTSPPRSPRMCRRRTSSPRRTSRFQAGRQRGRRCMAVTWPPLSRSTKVRSFCSMSAPALSCVSSDCIRFSRNCSVLRPGRDRRPDRAPRLFSSPGRRYPGTRARP